MNLQTIKAYLFTKLFPKEAHTMKNLFADNEELQGICMEQIQQIRDLEDANYKLDFEKEDLELKVELLEDKIEDLEIELEYVEGVLDQARNEIQVLWEDRQ